MNDLLSEYEQMRQRVRDRVKADHQKILAEAKVSPDHKCQVWCFPLWGALTEIHRNMIDVQSLDGVVADQVFKKCVWIAEKVTSFKDISEYAGRNRIAMAAGIYYVAGLMVADPSFTQRDMAWVSGITEVTIRKSYQSVIEILKAQGWKPT